MQYIITYPQLVNFSEALQIMLHKAEDVKNSGGEELFWLLQHDHVYTSGISSSPLDPLPAEAKVIAVKRGGKHTYHGPGQVIGYLVMDIIKWNKGIIDLKKFIAALHNLIIMTLADFGIQAFTDPNLIGVWVKYPDSNKKIAAVGINLSKGITSHGFALNVTNDLSYFSAISPCGLKADSVCSMHDLIGFIEIIDVMRTLEANFKKIFFT